MKTAYIVDITRTPVGKFGGTLSTVRPDDLAAHVLKSLVSRNPNIDFRNLEDVFFGAANQSGEDNRNVARMAGLLAGLPIESGGVTVNRLCASGMQAIIQAAQSVMLNDGELFLAGGVESMTRAPFVMAKADSAFARKVEIYDTSIGWRFTNPKLAEQFFVGGMGETAENVAQQWKITREEQDIFAYNSQLKYKKAFENNRFNEEISTIQVQLNKKERVLFEHDEHPRLSSVEKLSELKPAFKKDGTVTAGNSSGINDGAAACIVVSEEFIKKYNLTPLARVASYAVAGVDPAIMGIGPVPATKKALIKAGLSMKDIDLIELNEAFASQSIACMRELEIDESKVNVNGGSIAIGHPLGASGCRISATLIHEMQKRESARYGLATMCVGVGQGAAIIFEKV